MVGYNNKILISNTDMKICFNKDVNKDCKKLLLISLEAGRAESAAPKMLKSTDKLIKDCLSAQHEQKYNQKVLAKKHNDKKLVITLLKVGAGLIVYCFC